MSDTTRPRLRRLLRYHAENGLQLPSTLIMARTLGVTAWTVQWHLGQMHDQGQITLRGAGRRRVVEFPNGRKTA